MCCNLCNRNCVVVTVGVFKTSSWASHAWLTLPSTSLVNENTAFIALQPIYYGSISFGFRFPTLHYIVKFYCRKHAYQQIGQYDTSLSPTSSEFTGCSEFEARVRRRYLFLTDRLCIRQALGASRILVLIRTYKTIWYNTTV